MNTENMKMLRHANKLSQSEIAYKIGTSQSNYGKMENGEIEANVEKLIKLADLYNVTLDYLVGRPYSNDIGYMNSQQTELVKSILLLNEQNLYKVAGYTLGLLASQN